MSFTANISYTNAASLSFDPAFVEISPVLGATLKDLGGGTYTTTPQLITSADSFLANELSFTGYVGALPNDSNFLLQFMVAGIVYWYDGANWAVSDGSASQANTITEVNAQAADFFTDLDIPAPALFGFRLYLVSDLGTTTPQISSMGITYEWNGTPQAINECVLYAFLSDLVGSTPYDATKPSKFLVSCSHAFMHGQRMIQPFTKEATFDANGYASLSVIETETPGIPLSFAFTYYDGFSIVNSQLFNAIVPDASSAGINSLTTIVPYDFG